MRFVLHYGITHLVPGDAVRKSLHPYTLIAVADDYPASVFSLYDPYPVMSHANVIDLSRLSVFGKPQIVYGVFFSVKSAENLLNDSLAFFSFLFSGFRKNLSKTALLFS